jgi:hypothetical protein
MYFDINEINKEDLEHVYDIKHLLDGTVSVSLKRPYARKYCPDGFCEKKSIGAMYI